MDSFAAFLTAITDSGFFVVISCLTGVTIPASLAAHKISNFQSSFALKGIFACVFLAYGAGHRHGVERVVSDITMKPLGVGGALQTTNENQTLIHSW